MDLALSLELAYSNGPCRQVRRAIAVVASTSALGTLAVVEGKERAGSCQSQQDKYACCKAILGVSLLSDPTEHPLWSFNFLAGMSPAESAPKEKTSPVTFFKVPRALSLFILLKQANARFSKTLQLPSRVGEICHQLKPRQAD